jgi:hypothetical protein
MKISVTFDIPLYAAKVHFTVARDARKVINRIFRKHNTNQVYKDTVAGMMITFSMDLYHIVIDENHLTYNTVVHELYHAATQLMRDRNIFEEESSAWTAGFIAERVFGYLKSKEIEVL